jgi:hypothetical protein
MMHVLAKLKNKVSHNVAAKLHACFKQYISHGIKNVFKHSL